jgi:hypothetical protein
MRALARPSGRELTVTTAKLSHFFDVVPEGLVGAQRGEGGKGKKTTRRRRRRRRRIRSTGKRLADRAEQQSPIMQHHNHSYTRTHTHTHINV